MDLDTKNVERLSKEIDELLQETEMEFMCIKCKLPFAKAGLEVKMHGELAGRVCPECLAGATDIILAVSRTAPGKPYILQHAEIEKIPNN